MALETEKLDLDDLAPRIKELRAEQASLQMVRDEAFAELEDTAPRELDTGQVLVLSCIGQRKNVEGLPGEQLVSSTRKERPSDCVPSQTGRWLLEPVEQR